MKPSIIFGLNVKKELKEQGITQTALAKTLNTGKSTLCEWLNGNNEPPMEQLLKIATVLNVSVDYLVGRDSDVRVISKGGNLTKNESEILRIFTMLDEVQQNRVIGYAYALAR